MSLGLCCRDAGQQRRHQNGKGEEPPSSGTRGKGVVSGQISSSWSVNNLLSRACRHEDRRRPHWGCHFPLQGRGRAAPQSCEMVRRGARQTHNRRRPRAGGSGRDVGTNCSANDGTTRSHLLDHVGDRQTYMITFSTSYRVFTDRNIQYIDSKHHMQDFCSRFNEKFKGGCP